MGRFCKCGFEIAEGLMFCGRCGAKQEEPKPAAPEDLTTVPGVLRTIVLSHVEALEEVRLLKAILGDYLPEKRLERNLLLRAWESGVVEALRKVKQLEPLLFGRLVSILVEEHGISLSHSRRVVLEWSYGLQIDTSNLPAELTQCDESVNPPGESSLPLSSSSSSSYSSSFSTSSLSSSSASHAAGQGSGSLTHVGGRTPPWRVAGGSSQRRSPAAPINATPAYLHSRSVLGDRPDNPFGEGPTIAKGHASEDYQQALALTKAGQEKEAVNYLRSAAEQGHIQAAFLLGNCYYYSKGIAANPNKAMKWYRQAADGGIAQAQCIVGMALEGGKNGLYVDVSAAVKYYEKAANQGWPEAQYRLGLCYCDGIGVSVFPGRALSWLEKAAVQGYGAAQLKLAKLYEEGYFGGPEYRKALKWYLKAAERGNRIAQYQAGHMLESGVAGITDVKAAAQLYLEAVKQQYAPAYAALGKCYEEGKGLEIEAEAAFKYYQKGAQAGEAIAMSCLGRCYQLGLGVVSDAGKMVQWYQQAGAAGVPEALYSLGWCYENGYYGVSQSYRQAAEYYQQAGSQGHAEAKAALKRLEDSQLLSRMELKTNVPSKRQLTIKRL